MINQHVWSRIRRHCLIGDHLPLSRPLQATLIESHGLNVCPNANVLQLVDDYFITARMRSLSSSIVTAALVCDTEFKVLSILNLLAPVLYHVQRLLSLEAENFVLMGFRKNERLAYAQKTLHDETPLKVKAKGVSSIPKAFQATHGY